MKEKCNECGRSVNPGSSLFVDRVTSFDNYSEQEQMGEPFPESSFICRDCDDIISNKNKV